MSRQILNEIAQAITKAAAGKKGVLKESDREVEAEPAPVRDGAELEMSNEPDLAAEPAACPRCGKALK